MVLVVFDYFVDGGFDEVDGCEYVGVECGILGVVVLIVEVVWWGVICVVDEDVG